jgi:chlorophyllide a reductase subunit Y
VPLDLLPDEINGVRIIGIDVPGFGVPTHAEAKDVLAGALLRYARKEASAGPVARPEGLVEDKPTVTLLGELFPADPMGINAMLAPMGVAVGSTVPPREWRELYKALDCDVVGAVHPFYTRSVRELKAAGRPVVGSAPVGMDGSAAWLKAIGEATGTAGKFVDAAVDAAVGACKGAYQKMPVDGRIVVSGYEGSELLVARVLIESGAEVPYVGTALPKTPWSAQDREWLAQHGCHVQYRARLEDDKAAYRDVNPDLVLGTTPTVQSAKEDGIPALYFTNLISARPIFGPAGAGGLSAVIGGAMRGKERLGKMRAFFQGVGEGHTAGYGWTEVPERHLSAKERNAKARGGAAVTGDDAGEAGGGSPKSSAESPKDAAGSPKGAAESPNAAAESQPQPAEASA